MSVSRLCRQCYHFKLPNQCWKFRDAATKAYLVAPACRNDVQLCGPTAEGFDVNLEGKLYFGTFLLGSGGLVSGAFSAIECISVSGTTLHAVCYGVGSLGLLVLSAAAHEDSLGREREGNCIDVKVK
jgi:hypothetical protein